MGVDINVIGVSRLAVARWRVSPTSMTLSSSASGFSSSAASIFASDAFAVVVDALGFFLTNVLFAAAAASARSFPSSVFPSLFVDASASPSTSRFPPCASNALQPRHRARRLWVLPRDRVRRVSRRIGHRTVHRARPHVSSPPYSRRFDRSDCRDNPPNARASTRRRRIVCNTQSDARCVPLCTR